MNNDTETMSYIGRKPCGCIVCATVDIPDMQKDNAKEIAKWMQWGLTIERVTVEYVRQNFNIDCDHDKPQKRKKAEQPTLF